MAVAKSEAVGQCRDAMHGRSMARSVITDGIQRQREIQGPVPAYKDARLLPKTMTLWASREIGSTKGL